MNDYRLLTLEIYIEDKDSKIFDENSIAKIKDNIIYIKN